MEEVSNREERQKRDNSEKFDGFLTKNSYDVLHDTITIVYGPSKSTNILEKEWKVIACRLLLFFFWWQLFNNSGYIIVLLKILKVHFKFPFFIEILYF